MNQSRKKNLKIKKINYLIYSEKKKNNVEKKQFKSKSR